jgi:hypothetical protein
MPELSEADRRLNVEGVILAVVSNYGGERLVADNPAMPRLVSQLADEFDALALAGRFLPQPAGYRLIEETPDAAA